MFKICDEPESTNKVACLRYFINRNHPMRGRVVFER